MEGDYNAARLVTWDFILRLKAWSDKYQCDPFKVIDLANQDAMELVDLDYFTFGDVDEIISDSMDEFKQNLTSEETAI